MLLHYLDPDRAHVLRTYISALEQECGCCESGSGERACVPEQEVPAEVHARIVRFRSEIRVRVVRRQSDAPAGRKPRRRKG
jgi:hypothetical protein